MDHNTYEILTKCYGDSKDGISVIKDGLIKYCNDTMNSISGRDILNQCVLDIFPTDFIERFIGPIDSDGAAFSDCVDIFGKPTEIRSFRVDSSTVLVFTRLDALTQKLYKNDESFKAIKATYTKLMNLLSVINSATDMTVKACISDSYKAMPMWLNIISDGVLELNSAVMDLAEILESREENIDKGCCIEDVAALINSAAEVSERSFTLRNIGIAVTCTPKRLVFTLNRKSFLNMVLRMLSHELETTDKGGLIKLNAQCDDEILEISVSDNCRHEPQEHISFLEKPTLENMDRILSRYGNNLYLLRRLVMFYDGTLRVENISKGKKITIALPRIQTLPYVQQNIEPLDGTSDI